MADDSTVQGNATGDGRARRIAHVDGAEWAAAIFGAAAFCGIFVIRARGPNILSAFVILILLALGVAAAVTAGATAFRRGMSVAPSGLLLLGTLSIATIFVLELLPPRRHMCPSHVRQIGQGLFLYAHENGDRSPDTLHELVSTVDINPEVFVCPDDDDAGDGTTRTTYVYLKPKRPFASVLAEEVLVYEPLKVHRTGGHILFGDGRVEWIEAPAHERVLADARAITECLDSAASTWPITQNSPPR